MGGNMALKRERKQSQNLVRLGEVQNKFAAENRESSMKEEGEVQSKGGSALEGTGGNFKNGGWTRGPNSMGNCYAN